MRTDQRVFPGGKTGLRKQTADPLAALGMTKETVMADLAFATLGDDNTGP
jgi:hypothetical protein